MTQHDDMGEVGTIPLDMVRTHPGLDLIRMMIAGELPPPPISRTFKFAPVEADEGRAVFRGMPLYDHYNPAGVVHGGWHATLLDSAMGCAVQTMLPAGTGFTTVEFKVNLVRPLLQDSGEVTCEGKVVSFGRTIATADGRLVDMKGKLIAHGTATCAIRPLPPAQPGDHSAGAVS